MSAIHEFKLDVIRDVVKKEPKQMYWYCGECGREFEDLKICVSQVMGGHKEESEICVCQLYKYLIKKKEVLVYINGEKFDYKNKEYYGLFMGGKKKITKIEGRKKGRTDEGFKVDVNGVKFKIKCVRCGVFKPVKHRGRKYCDDCTSSKPTKK